MSLLLLVGGMAVGAGDAVRVDILRLLPLQGSWGWLNGLSVVGALRLAG